MASTSAFSDISGRSETSLSAPRIDNLGNEEDGERLGRVHCDSGIHLIMQVTTHDEC